MDCAYLFSCTSNSVSFVSGSEGFFCTFHGDPASQQKPPAGTRRVCRATLHQPRGCKAATWLLHSSPSEAIYSVRGLHPCGICDANALLKASPLCHGTADPASSLCGIPPFSDTSPFSPGPLPVSKARLGVISFSKDFRQPWVSTVRANSACKAWGAVRPVEEHSQGSCTADISSDETEAKGRVNHLSVCFSVFAVQRRWDSDKPWVMEVNLYPLEYSNT